eukprot:SAG11_NODE_1801_length_4241_cov_7.942781_6_plen_120_part_00
MCLHFFKKTKQTCLFPAIKYTYSILKKNASKNYRRVNTRHQNKKYAVPVYRDRDSDVSLSVFLIYISDSTGTKFSTRILYRYQYWYWYRYPVRVPTDLLKLNLVDPANRILNLVRGQVN